jgi:hypothetical protein
MLGCLVDVLGSSSHPQLILAIAYHAWFHPQQLILAIADHAWSHPQSVLEWCHLTLVWAIALQTFEL